MGVKPLPFWVWFALAKRLHHSLLYRTDRHGAVDRASTPFKFGERITLPQTYWDGGVWAMPEGRVSADDPGEGRARLYIYLQNLGFGRQKPLFISRRYFPRGTGLNWRYEALRSTYGLSPDAARLVISIEEGKEYSESALWTARHRERETIKAILARPTMENQNMTFEEFKHLREMFPSSRKVRISHELPDFWAPQLASFLTKGSLLGKVITIPTRPPACKVFEGISPSTSSISM